MNIYQEVVFKEAKERKRCCLSLPMGFGKTLIGLNLARRFYRIYQKPALVIVSKSLISSWIYEIEKFFPNQLNYLVLHSDYIKQRDLDRLVLAEEVELILTTQEVVVSAFNKNELSQYAVEMREGVLEYNSPSAPYLYQGQGKDILFSTTFSCLLIDEIQNYTEIKTMKCKAIGSIFALHRYGLTGTVLPEPTSNRVLGYYYLLNLPGVSYNIREIRKWLQNGFPGFKATMIIRKDNPAFDMSKIKLNDIIVDVPLREIEVVAYKLMKDIIRLVIEKIKKYRMCGNSAKLNQYNSYALVMLGYLRRIIISPYITLSNARDTVKRNPNSGISKTLLKHFQKTQLYEWALSNEARYSSRVESIIQHLRHYLEERVIIFTTSRDLCNILMKEITGRPVFTVRAIMKINERMKLIQDYANTPNGVLVITYQLGSFGLNLQAASTVFLADVLWNNDVTKQAIARVLRYGQEAKQINVVRFTSKTAYEELLFTKHLDKNSIKESLMDGPSRLDVNVMHLDKIIKIIDNETNIRLINLLKKL